MLTLRKIVVTGGLSSGKTTACSIFKDLGAYVVNADTIVHHLLSPDTDCGQQVIHLLGPSIIIDHKLNRKKIAESVFSDPEKLKKLEDILHPAVFEEIERQYIFQNNKKPKPPLFVAEIPLFYETTHSHHYDAVICVTADSAICRRRFASEKNRTYAEFDNRMKRQIDLQEKETQATYVIQNNGNLIELKEKTKKLYSLLTST